MHICKWLQTRFIDPKCVAAYIRYIQATDDRTSQTTLTARHFPNWPEIPTPRLKQACLISTVYIKSETTRKFNWLGETLWNKPDWLHCSSSILRHTERVEVPRGSYTCLRNNLLLTKTIGKVWVVKVKTRLLLTPNINLHTLQSHVNTECRKLCIYS